MGRRRAGSSTGWDDGSGRRLSPEPFGVARPGLGGFEVAVAGRGLGFEGVQQAVARPSNAPGCDIFATTDKGKPSGATLTKT